MANVEEFLFDDRVGAMAGKMQVAVAQVGESPASEAEIRGHKVRFDRPAEKGGGDSGPMGGEVFLASVAGCFMSNLLAAMRAREVQGRDVRAVVTGTLDGNPARFIGIELLVESDGVERETMEKLVEIAGRGCIMVNTLRDKMDFSIRLA